MKFHKCVLSPVVGLGVASVVVGRVVGRVDRSVVVVVFVVVGRVVRLVVVVVVVGRVVRSVVVVVFGGVRLVVLGSGVVFGFTQPSSQ